MTLFFCDPVGCEQPGAVNFAGCTEITHCNREVVARIDGRDYCVARVEVRNGIACYAIHPQTYAAIFRCPVMERPAAFWAFKVRN